MRRTKLLAGSILAAFALSGCATLEEHPVACKVGAGLIGATLGGVGGGVGVDQIERHRTTLTERAAGAAAGAAVGGLVGFVVGHFACPEAAPPPPPPPPPARTPPPPPPPPPSDRRGG